MEQELKMVEQTSGFWADAIAVAASPVAITAGVVRGSYEAASGAGPFTEGFHAAADPVIASARKFGTEHQDTITTGSGASAAAAPSARRPGAGLRCLSR